MYDDTRMKVFQSDLTQDQLSTNIPADTVDIVLLFFVLSSITPDKMLPVLMNISKVSVWYTPVLNRWERTAVRQVVKKFSY